MASSCVTALRVSTGFLLRQARCPLLHLARAMSVSACVQGRVEKSASRVARFSRIGLAKCGVVAGNQSTRKKVDQSSLQWVFHASQHRMSVPRYRFRSARKAVEVIESFAPVQSGVCLDSSRLVIFLDLSRRTLNSANAQNGSIENLWSS